MDLVKTSQETDDDAWFDRGRCIAFNSVAVLAIDNYPSRWGSVLF